MKDFTINGLTDLQFICKDTAINGTTRELRALAFETYERVVKTLAGDWCLIDLDAYTCKNWSRLSVYNYSQVRSERVLAQFADNVYDVVCRVYTDSNGGQQ